MTTYLLYIYIYIYKSKLEMINIEEQETHGKITKIKINQRLNSKYFF